MKISILLPYKENYAKDYAGAVSVFINGINKKSIYRSSIKVFGNTDYENILIAPSKGNISRNVNPDDFEASFFSEVDDKTAKRIIELEAQGIYGDEAYAIIEKENQENQEDRMRIRERPNIEQINKIINEVLPFNETFNDNFLETIIPISTNFTPVQPGSGSFELIDLRTIKEKGKKTPSKDGAATQLNNTIPKLNPSKSYSIFESFLKEHP